MNLAHGKTPGQMMYSAVRSGDHEAVIEILRNHPGELTASPGMASSWLHYAAGKGWNKIIDVFLSAGQDVDFCTVNNSATPLADAVDSGQLETARYLLSLGADPNKDRMLIGAINSDTNSFELVKLLVESGIDVNLWWRFGDEETGPIFNALSWAIDNDRDDIAEYLRSHGARMPKVEEKVSVPGNPRQEILTHFGRQFGPVMPQALREVVPSPFPIEIHLIPPTKDRAFTTLFTTGMSDQPMSVPPGGEAFRFAELLIHLPKTWPLDLQSLKKLESRWPMDWLRRIAAYPHQQQTWLGGPITIISNGSPPDPLGPQCRFTALLLMADYEEAKSLQLADGRTVRFYTLMPLYPEEHLIEQTQGLPELFRRFDRLGTPKVVDTKRRNVARL